MELFFIFLVLITFVYLPLYIVAEVNRRRAKKHYWRQYMARLRGQE
jgi:hypothetical protein